MLFWHKKVFFVFGITSASVHFFNFTRLKHSMLCMLGKHFSKAFWHFSYYSQKIDLETACKLSPWRQFAWNVKAYYLGKKKKKKVIHLSSTEFAPLRKISGQIQQTEIWNIFLIFPIPETNCLLPKETICRKCHSLFSGKNKKNISKVVCWNFTQHGKC